MREPRDPLLKVLLVLYPSDDRYIYMHGHGAWGAKARDFATGFMG